MASKFKGIYNINKTNMIRDTMGSSLLYTRKWKRALLTMTIADYFGIRKKK